MSDQHKVLAAHANEAPEPARQFWELWQRDGVADLRLFLTHIGPLPPVQLAAVVCVDLRERWHRRERPPAEEYLQAIPELRADVEAALDVVYCEFLVRDELGEMPAPAEFLNRFPEHAAELQLQMQVHGVLGADTSTARTVSRPPPLSNSPVEGGTPLERLPATFGRYRIQELLGRGGMGEVYLAHDTQLGRDVALKVMRLSNEDRVHAERFQREARIAAALDHPNFCPIFDVGELGGILYLTMPRLRGETLAQRLAREPPLSPTTAAHLVAQVARAMHVAHQVGVYHRDLKPSNIMVDEAGKPVVMDFGLARRRSPDDPCLTLPGGVVGTPAYLAPERIGGEPVGASAASDVYSLGVVLYEMLTGRLPFRGTVAETLHKAQKDNPPSPAGSRPDLDPGLAAVCLTALAKDPAERFASMEEFAAALEDCLDRAERVARNGNWRRRRWAVAAAVLGFVLLALGVWLVVLSRGGTPHGRPAADLFQAGSRWQGEFHFGGKPGIEDGTLQVIVTERTGADFRGTYVTNPGNYGWHIAGTIRDNQARWGFTAVLEGTTLEPNLVDNGSVAVTLEGDTLTGTFNDRNDDTWATIALKRQR